MDKIKTDRRVVKTRKAIHNAFVELVTTKDARDITVRDLAKLANINRKTFYNHYNDINELIDEIENEIIIAFDEAMAGIDLSKALEDPVEICRRLLAIGYNLKDICAHLMKIEYDGALVRKIASALISSIKKTSADQIHVDDKTLTQMMEFVVAGMLQNYQTWFNSDRSEPIEELTLRIGRLIVSGLNGVRDAYLNQGE
ncbi:MAG: TetR/AcrR family transcriptional regulator C-terminal domain-containing protein [Mogibacterium sp.]|nr:TetR/AcrR family transcriptional regulator C-terminal domain-containing protein [Mogibacterium sp.]